jgi:hypothetical protein
MPTLAETLRNHEGLLSAFHYELHKIFSQGPVDKIMEGPFVSASLRYPQDLLTRTCTRSRKPPGTLPDLHARTSKRGSYKIFIQEPPNNLPSGLSY